jgi:hypothetical protein
MTLTLPTTPAEVAAVSARTLPALPAIPAPADFRGPTPWSNWFIQGRALAGAYPATPDDAETDALLTRLLELGVDTFVCLQAEFSLAAPEAAWRAGQALRPYVKDAQRLLVAARAAGSTRITQVGKGKCTRRAARVAGTRGRSSGRRGSAPLRPAPLAALSQDRLDFLHLPIIDGSVTSDHAISRLADDCAQRVLDGERLYVHCWGGCGAAAAGARDNTPAVLIYHTFTCVIYRASLGAAPTPRRHGRTGTLVAVMLARLYGLSSAEALAYTQALHDVRRTPQGVRSPQTQVQVEQVKRVLSGEAPGEWGRRFRWPARPLAAEPRAGAAPAPAAAPLSGKAVAPRGPVINVTAGGAPLRPVPAWVGDPML